MIYILINAVPILAAAVAGLVAGWLYLFACNARPVPPPGRAAISVAFVAQAWLAAILAGALILAPPKAGVWPMTIGSAVVIWIGFAVPVMIVTGLRQRATSRAIVIDCGHWLVIMLVQVIVLRLIGLTPPTG